MAKKYSELEIRDDFMFGKATENPEICAGIIERVTGLKVDAIDYLENQKSVRVTSEGRDIRMDTYVEDSEGTVYDAEMQNRDSRANPELPKRSRYYQGMIDLNMIGKGISYHELKQCYVIFICTYDPFGKGYCRYVFENTCNQNSDLKLSDGTVKIFINTKSTMEADGSKAPDGLRQFIHYVETKEATDEFTRTLDKEVNRIRGNREWERDYMKTYVHDMDMKYEGRQEGIEIGIEIGMERGIEQNQYDCYNRCIKSGMSKEEAMELSGATKELLDRMETATK